jgi:hypothetical protein
LPLLCALALLCSCTHLYLVDGRGRVTLGIIRLDEVARNFAFRDLRNMFRLVFLLHIGLDVSYSNSYEHRLYI